MPTPEEPTFKNDWAPGDHFSCEDCPEGSHHVITRTAPSGLSPDTNGQSPLELWFDRDPAAPISGGESFIYAHHATVVTP